MKREFISRLLRYKNVAVKLKRMGIVRIFSDNLGDAAGVTSSQVRKDFCQLGIKGNKRGGYQADELLDALEAVIGRNDDAKLIIVGFGNIGRALINYPGYQQSNMRIVACFDNDREKIDKEGDIPVFHISEMETFIRENGVKIGIISVPEAAAAEIYDRLLNAGIKGVLNFARVFLRETSDCIVNTINIEMKIENLCYFVKLLEEGKMERSANGETE